MFYCGLDIGRRVHEIATATHEQASDPDAWKRIPTCRFTVSALGFAALDTYLANFSDNPKDFRLAMEPTGGAYPRTVVHHLERRGFVIEYIANDHIRHYRQLYARDAGKTDAVDARILARALYLDAAGIVAIPGVREFGSTADALRAIVRDINRLEQAHTRTGNQLHMVLAVVWPEFPDTVTANVRGKLARAILSRWPTPASFSCEKPEEVAAVLTGPGLAARRRYIPKWQEAAGHSIGVTVGVEHDLLRMRNLLAELIFQEEQLARLDTQLAAIEEEYLPMRLVQSIPGIGRRCAAALMGAAGDISRFRNERQFQKYVGFSPVRYESGSSIKGAYLSHVGDRACRRALFLAALVIQSDSVPKTAFRVLAERLRAKGKHGWNINCHVAGALARAVYHTLKRGEPYEVERHLEEVERKASRCP